MKNYLSPLISHLSSRKGFTLIEMIVVVSIIITLLGFITISLVSSLQNTSLTSTQNILLADLRQQQLKSMIGDTEGRLDSDAYGIHFDSSRYVLFHGTYLAEETSNSVVNLDSNMQFVNPGFDVIFSKLSGEIPAPMIIELQDNTNNKIKRIYLNAYGVVTGVD